MIKYGKQERCIKFDENILEKLKKFVSENGSKNVEDVDIKELIEIMHKFIETAQEYDTTVDAYKRESESEAREYFGKEFIQEFESIFKQIRKSNCHLAIHGTGVELMDSILKNGLKSVSDSLFDTSYTMEIDDEYMYTKLLNWQHKEAKGLIIIAVPFECCTKDEGVKALWIDNQSSEQGIYKTYLLKPEFIFGCIDVNKKEIKLNPLYNRQHNYDELQIIDEFPLNPLLIKEQTEIKSNLENSDESEEYKEQYKILLEIINKNEKEKSRSELYNESINYLRGFFVRFEIGKVFTDNEGYPIDSWKNEKFSETLDKLSKITRTSQLEEEIKDIQQDVSYIDSTAQTIQEKQQARNNKKNPNR